MEELNFCNNRAVDLEYVSIQCQRIKLAPICEQFADDIFREFTTEITKYMMPSPTKDISETNEFIANSIQNMQQKKELVLAITATDGEFLGCVGFHGRGHYHTPELGIWLKQAAHGKRYGQEAITHLLAWAEEHIDFDYVIYPVDKSNIASRKIPESLGGLIFKEVKVKTFSGDILDEVVYKIPKKRQ